MRSAHNPISIPLPKSSEMLRAENAVISNGTPAIDLMNRAAAELFRRLLRVTTPKQRARVAILAGPGNNGGDGIALARLLSEDGTDTTLVLACSERHSDLWQAQIKTLDTSKVKIFFFGGPVQISGLLAQVAATDELISIFQSCDLLVDALLGIGQTSPPRGAIAEILNLLNLLNLPDNPIKVSIDTPSGMNPDTGEIFNPSFKSDITITVQGIKRGMTQYPAREICGSIEVIDIGVPLADFVESELITLESLPKYPNRSANFHKGDAGKVLVIGGSKDMPGAVSLTGLGALKSGAGIVYTAVYRDLIPYYPELISVRLPGDLLDFRSLEAIEAVLTKVDSVVLGPGLGLATSTLDCCRGIIERVQELRIPMVIDADALSAIKGLYFNSDQVVITPHPGEAARLLECRSDEVQSDRFRASEELSKRYGCCSVLKGASSIINYGSRSYVNSTGNPWMATAGSGDVLSGVIATLLAQKIGTVNASVLAVFIHGMAGNLAHTESRGPILASEIAKFIPSALGEILDRD